jgi:O-antigen/teichoic acid export membrane protein
LTPQKEIIKPSLIKKISAPFKDKGVQALVVTNVLGNVIRLLSNLILARFLSPDAFAITGLAATVIFAFNMISDGGFRAFILRHQCGDDDSVLNTLWTVKLLRNLVLAALLFVSSGAIATFLGIGELGSVLKILSLIFIMDGLVPIGFIAIERQNRVSVIMYITFACTVLSTIYSVIGVYYYQTFWPIIHAMVLNYVFQIIMAYIVIGSAGTAIAIDKKVFVEFLGWVKYIIPSSVITLLLVQFDKVILSKSLTLTELGLYFVAFNFSSAAATFSIQYARGVLQPYLSKIYREAPEVYLDRYYEKKLKLSILLSFLLGGLSGGSYLFFDILYDDEYLSAGYYLAILLVTPIMALITYSSEITLILFGQIKMTLVANIIRLVWFVLGAWLGYVWFGVTGLLLAIALLEVLPAVYMLCKLKVIGQVRIINECFILLSALMGFLFVRMLSL